MQASPDEFSKITTDFKVKLTIKLSKYNKYTSSEVFCDLSLRKLRDAIALETSNNELRTNVY